MGKGRSSDFQGLGTSLDTRSELKWTPRDPKYECFTPAKTEVCGNQLVNTGLVLASQWVHLLLGSTPAVISLVSEHIFIVIYGPTSSAGSSKKQECSRKTSISALLTMPKPLTVWITINCVKFWKRWEYQTTWPDSWETYMQVRKQQLELDMEQQTGSK